MFSFRSLAGEYLNIDLGPQKKCMGGTCRNRGHILVKLEGNQGKMTNELHNETC